MEGRVGSALCSCCRVGLLVRRVGWEADMSVEWRRRDSAQWL